MPLKLDNPMLYLVTDDRFTRNTLEKDIEDAILGGVNVLQLREKNLSSRKFYERALRIKEITSYYKVPFIINDRLDIALAVDADGLHIGQSDLPIEIVKGILKPGKIIGLSASTLSEAIEGEKKGADYLGIGAMFPTGTKTDARYVSLDELKTIKESVSIPLVAIGGINVENTPSICTTGVDGIAVVSAILDTDNPREASSSLLEVMKKNMNI